MRIIMEIRKTRPEDLDRLMEIYAYARDFMKNNGNPRQWSAYNWPPVDLIKKDIEDGDSYVCVHDGRIVGTFYFVHGDHIEPTYEVIEEGNWIGDDNYGVVHRIAGDGSVKGIGTFCIDWAFAQCGHLRIDTHCDNKPMQNLMKKLGFSYCGIIHVVQDPDIRLAYEKI